MRFVILNNNDMDRPARTIVNEREKTYANSIDIENNILYLYGKKSEP